MSLKSILFQHLSVEERAYIMANSGRIQFPEFPEFTDRNDFGRMIPFFTNSGGCLDKTENSPEAILPFMFHPLDKLKDYIFDNQIVHWQHVSLHIQVAQELIKPVKSHLLSSIDTCKPADTTPNPKEIVRKMKINMLQILEEIIIKKWQKISDQFEQICKMDELFKFDLLTEKFLPINSLKKWEDLRPTESYFSMPQDITSDLQMLSCISPEHKEEVSHWFEHLKKKSLNEPQELFSTLKGHIQHYHGLEKGNANNLTHRLKALLKIIAEVDSLLVHKDISDEQRLTVKEIKNQSQYKVDFIRGMLKLKTTISNRIFRLEHCEGIPLITDKEDNLSDIDPYHRYVSYTMNQYLQKWLDSKSNQPFLLWLEANEKVTSDDFSIDSRYEQPIENTKVNITNGYCYNKLCSKANNHLIQDGVYLYNIDRQGDLYILPPTRDFGYGSWGTRLKCDGVKLSVGYNHNSILHGANISCAGCIVFYQGKIVQIDNNSGHYKPSLFHLKHALQKKLFKLGVFAPEAVVNSFHSRSDCSKEVPLNTFMQPDFNIQSHFASERMNKHSISISPEMRSKLEGRTTTTASSNSRRDKLLLWAKSIQALQNPTLNPFSINDTIANSNKRNSDGFEQGSKIAATKRAKGK